MSARALPALAASAGLLCAVHCAVMPLAISFLPLVGRGFLHNEWLEVGLLATAIPLGGIPITKGYRAVHRNPFPAALFVAGALSLVFARFLDPALAELAVAVTGGVLLAAAQVWNIKLGARCGAPGHSHGHS